MADTYELAINQGANLEISFVLNDENGAPLNLTGYTARMQLRTAYTSPNVAMELTTENGRIVITPLTGKIALNAPASITTNLIAQRYVYDLEMVSGSGYVTRVVQGDAVISPEVTR
jgi:hypothetical protein